jgi:hypothetical protein
MIVGTRESFAIEAVLEPERSFGRNVAGRFRLFLGGHPVGDFAEPGCTFGQFSDQLVTLASSARSLWHPSLNGLSPPEIFARLNHALFVGGVAEPPTQYHLMSFLTNVSEVFNHVKGFLVSPEPDQLLALVELQVERELISQRIPYTQFASVAAQFATWLREQEEEHLRGNAA